MHSSLVCLMAVAQAWGLPFDAPAIQDRWGLSGDQPPGQDTLAAIAAEHRLRASLTRLDRDGLSGRDVFPCIAFLANGNAVALLGADLQAGSVRLLDPLATTPDPFDLDLDSFEASWTGQALLLAPDPANAGLRCLALVARHQGADASLEDLTRRFGLERAEADASLLVRIARELGLAAKRRRLTSRQVTALAPAMPFTALLPGGRALVLAGLSLPGGEAPGKALEKAPEEVMVEVVDPMSLPIRRERLPLEDLFRDWDGWALLTAARRGEARDAKPFGLGWFLPELTRHRRTFVDVALAAFMLSLLGLALPLYFQLVVDKVLAHRGLSTLEVLSLGMLAVLCFEAGFNYLRGRLLLAATTAVDMRVGARTFAKLVSLPLGFFGRARAGVIIQHMQQADKIREFLTGRLLFTLLDACALAVFLPFLFFQSTQLALLVAGFSVLLCLFVAVLLPFYRRRLDNLYRAEGERQAFLVETIRGMETVKALSLESRRSRAWEDRSARAVRTRREVGHVSVAASAGTGFLEKLMSLCIPWLGVFLVLENTLTVGGLVAFQMLAGRVSAPLAQIVSLIHEYQEKALSVRMLASVMDQPSERPAAKGGLRPGFREAIVFENVTFSYSPDAPPALREVSLRFPAGTFVGVAGRSGSGKSTLARLIQGLYLASSGMVSVDGHDIRECDLDHLRRHVGVVLQDSFLFTGAVRENIAAARPSATLNEVAWAASLAGATEFIRRLPQGFDTHLEENGANLSGGQRQRLAIARTLLAGPSVLVFDEATSALDPESEQIVQDNLEGMARGRLVVMISHRLSMLAGADAIVVMDEGRVADVGTHAELLARCQVYQTLWRSQNRHALGPGGQA